MKKLYQITLLLVFTAFTTAPAFGQAQDVVNVTATVKANITVETKQNVVFGNIAIGSSPAINPNGTPQFQDVNSAAAQWGKVKISASAGTNIIVSWSPNSVVTLNNSTDGQTLPFAIDISGSQNNSDAAGSTDLINGQMVTTSGASGMGSYYLYVGGNLGTIPGTQTTASYSGTLTVSVIYQ